MPPARDPASDLVERVTIDAFLGGRVEAVQPASGHHRAGLEAVFLAASLDGGTRGTVIDLGAGVGVAGLCIAARCPAASVVLVERDPFAVECAEAALSRPGNAAFAGRVTVIRGDIERREWLDQASADAVVLNPPFRDPFSTSASPAPARADAHILGEAGLDPWFRAAAALARAGGSATVIFHAGGLDAVLASAKGRFGALDILPLQPRAGEAAHRILVRGVKGSRAPLRLLPPIVLHNDTGNGFRPEVDAVLREGAGLETIVAPWKRGDSLP